MKELLRRLFRRKTLLLELLFATFFITLLNLASPLFVIQVLNRYVGFGFDGTLYTLTAGMLIAVALLFGFRLIRTKLAIQVSADPDLRLAAGVLETLLSAKPMALAAKYGNKAHEIVGKARTVQQAYDAGSISAIMDAPFSLLYVIVAFFLSPILGLIGLFGMGVTFFTNWMALKKGRVAGKNMQEASSLHQQQLGSAIVGVDTTRAFNGANFLRGKFKEQLRALATLKMSMDENSGLFQSAAQSCVMITSTIIYAIGAMQVVNGALSVGAMIGVNILVTRACQNASGFARAASLLGQSKDALRETLEFLSLPQEAESGMGMREYSGRIEFRDVAFGWPGATGPLFESLSFQLAPGSVMVVNGFNGAGKTSLARLIAGLLDPIRGEILVEGINLRQIAPHWWRQQIVYLPQEPTFLNATIRENIKAVNPNLDETQMNNIVNAVDLAKFLFSNVTGLETPITDHGRSLPLGVRRRLAMGRALATGGKLVILDEPTEGLDQQGVAAFMALLQSMVRAKQTIIVFTHDPGIIQGANVRLDLSVKPVPTVEIAQPQPQGVAPRKGAKA